MISKNKEKRPYFSEIVIRESSPVENFVSVRGMSGVPCGKTGAFDSYLRIVVLGDVSFVNEISFITGVNMFLKAFQVLSKGLEFSQEVSESMNILAKVF